MKTTTRALLVAAVVLVALLGALGYVLLGGRYSTRELSQAEVRKQPQTIGADYTSDFLSGKDGSRVANVYVVVGCWDNICTILVQIWHEEGTTVDEISLKFDPIYHGALSLKARGGLWPLAQFGADGTGVIYSIPDAGFQGTGTMNFEFCIRKDILASVASPADEISLHVDFTMHRDGVLKATRQHAEGDIYLGVP
jgi:hypothetical protein